MIREAFSRRLTPDRAQPLHDWATVERILDSILDAPPSEHSRILDNECAGNASLRTEVERILYESGKDNGFLELSAAEFAGDLAGNSASRNKRSLVLGGSLAAIAVAGTIFILVARPEPSSSHGGRTSGNASIRALDSIKSLSDSLHAAGVILREERKYADAEIALRRAATNRMMLSRRDRLPLAESLYELGVLMYRMGRNPESENLLRQSLDIHKREAKPRVVDIAVGETALATLLTSRQRPAEAEPLLRDAVATLTSQLASDDRRLIEARNALNETLVALGRQRETDSILAAPYRR